MSTQNATAVAITGGTVTGTTLTANSIYGTAITAGSFVVGYVYTIASVGTTSFTGGMTGVSSQRISAGYLTTELITASQLLYGVGYNTYYQIGDSTTTASKLTVSKVGEGDGFFLLSTL